MATHFPGPCSDGLLVIARHWRDDTSKGPSASVLSRNEVDIEERFKGLSAHRRAWPLEDDRIDTLCGDGGLLDCGLVPLSHLEYVVEYYRRAVEQAPCTLLYCQPLASWDEAELRDADDVLFCGYDYGYYLGAYNHFSAIDNDIIGGRYRELRAYEAYLNHDLLLPTLQLVQDVHHARTELILAGALLESNQSFIPIALFEPLVNGVLAKPA